MRQRGILEQNYNRFYLVMMTDDKPFRTKDLSSQIGSARLSFAKPEYMKLKL